MIRNLIFFILTVPLLAGCKVNYSFTGASISPEIKTFSISYFENYAPLAEPTLSQNFTETLKDYFLSQTNLKLVERNGDLQFSGEIVDYRTDPRGITANETAAINRLTITVNVKFVNTTDEKQNFERKFEKFADYESSQTLSQVEGQLITDINDQLAQDIFNASVGDW